MPAVGNYMFKGVGEGEKGRFLVAKEGEDYIRYFETIIPGHSD